MQGFVIQCVWKISPICRVLAFCGSFFFLPQPRVPGTASCPGKDEYSACDPARVGCVCHCVSVCACEMTCLKYELARAVSAAERRV